MGNYLENENNNNFINFNFGFVTDDCILENPQNNDAIKYPFTKISYIIPNNHPVSFLPYLLFPDEVFTYVSECILPNNMNRYIVSNYGRIYDLYLNKMVPSRFESKEFGFSRLRIHLSHYISDSKLKSEDLITHRVILESFCHNPNFQYLEVDHINGIYTDNRLCNLEWVSPEENMRRAHKNGLTLKGGDRDLDDINTNDVLNICNLYHTGMIIYDIAVSLNIKRSVVRDILCGFHYSEITSKQGIYNSIAVNIPDIEVHKICRLISSGMPISDISSMTGITKYQILDIIKRRSYVNISKEYNFMNANLEFRKTLTEQEVDEICRRLSLGEAPSSIARELGVSDVIVDNIKAGKVYTNISKNFGEFERLNRDRLPDEIVHNICLDLQNGAHNVDIMKKYNLMNSTVSRIRSGELYPQISCNYTLPKSEDLDKRRELSDEIVHKICKLLAEGKTPTETAEIVGIEVGKVNGIKSGTGYKDISSQYTFPRLTNLISDDQVRIVCTGLQEGWRLKDIIEKSKMCKRTIYRIRDRERYTEISKDYNW